VTTATIRVPALKVTVPLAAAALPRDLAPIDGPAGEPVLDLVLEGGALRVRAKLNGKNYRKLLGQVAEHGAGNVAVAPQGVLRPPGSPGGPLVLEGAGSRAVVKAARGRSRVSRLGRPWRRDRASPSSQAVPTRRFVGTMLHP
jgi:hypothetical protein